MDTITFATDHSPTFKGTGKHNVSGSIDVGERKKNKNLASLGHGGNNSIEDQNYAPETDRVYRSRNDEDYLLGSFSRGRISEKRAPIIPKPVYNDLRTSMKKEERRQSSSREYRKAVPINERQGFSSVKKNLNHPKHSPQRFIQMSSSTKREDRTPVEDKIIKDSEIYINIDGRTASKVLSDNSKEDGSDSVPIYKCIVPKNGSLKDLIKFNTYKLGTANLNDFVFISDSKFYGATIEGDIFLYTLNKQTDEITSTLKISTLDHIRDLVVDNNGTLIFTQLLSGVYAVPKGSSTPTFISPCSQSTLPGKSLLYLPEYNQLILLSSSTTLASHILEPPVYPRSPFLSFTLTDPTETIAHYTSFSSSSLLLLTSGGHFYYINQDTSQSTISLPLPSPTDTFTSFCQTPTLLLFTSTSHVHIYSYRVLKGVLSLSQHCKPLAASSCIPGVRCGALQSVLSLSDSMFLISSNSSILCLLLDPKNAKNTVFEEVVRRDGRTAGHCRIRNGNRAFGAWDDGLAWQACLKGNG